MDNGTLIFFGVAVLFLIGVGLLWLVRKRPGTFEGKVGPVEFKATSEAEQPRADQSQEGTVHSTQEQPRGANASQKQKDARDSSQKIS